jgi:hypothetical protein
MDGFSTRRSGSVGHEILNWDGEVIAWTVDGYWAAVIVNLLDWAEHETMHGPATCLPRPADDGHPRPSP